MAVGPRSGLGERRWVRLHRQAHRGNVPSSCPSRKQDSFIPGANAAQYGEYRPCKRCRPRERLGEDPDTKLVRLACDSLAASEQDPVGSEHVAPHRGISLARLRKTFKNVTGLSFHQFADARRLDQLKTLLRPEQAVTGALYDTGYKSTSRLY